MYLELKRNKAIQNGYGKSNNTQSLVQTKRGLLLGGEMPFGKHISHPVYVSPINHCEPKQAGNQKAAETSAKGRAMTAESSLNNNSVFLRGLLFHIIAVFSMQKIRFPCPTDGSNFPNN